MTENKQISRKDFMKGVGVTVAGVAVTGGLGGLLTGCAAPEAAADTTTAPEWPLPYQKLDADAVRERAYNAYFEKGG